MGKRGWPKGKPRGPRKRWENTNKCKSRTPEEIQSLDALKSMTTEERRDFIDERVSRPFSDGRTFICGPMRLSAEVPTRRYLIAAHISGAIAYEYLDNDEGLHEFAQRVTDMTDAVLKELEKTDEGR